ncbi:uncharacterized protein RCC_06173 [Ramularia collo-cygni]|uniref:Uncharacterized protein n=1 Tax=Ramularia collo-cygni TaxID=112498 RepID=A0A2D3VC55_9PEZI|nr:uncharacterized protein RCC_06173 [Ramularia collo-cygni]CZT20314.1 uncharacterized protein RCC_06173 [Ramularia collo-cygni]
MAGSITFYSSPNPRAPPQDGHVHQGAILYLPKRKIIDRKRKSHILPKFVGTIRSTGQIIKEHGKRHFKVLEAIKPAAFGAYGHPILVLSRPDEHTIEFVTLRSYRETELELMEDDWGWPEGQVKVEHHLSISPAEHPYVNKNERVNLAYVALRLRDDLQMSAAEGCLSVLPIHSMHWIYVERYFLKGQRTDFSTHWELDGPSMEVVLSLALQKAHYSPGPQHPRRAVS